VNRPITVPPCRRARAGNAEASAKATAGTAGSTQSNGLHHESSAVQISEAGVRILALCFAALPSLCRAAVQEALGIWRCVIAIQGLLKKQHRL